MAPHSSDLKNRILQATDIRVAGESATLGIFEAKHGIDFRIASKSFTGSYKVCVSDPSGRRVCHRWNLSRFCNCSVKIWEKNFPHALSSKE